MTEKIESRRDQNSFGLKLLDTAQVAEMLNVSESWYGTTAAPMGQSPDYRP